jgi:hypothetical protein
MMPIEMQKRQSFPRQIDSATPSVSTETGSHLTFVYKDAFPIPEGVDAVEWHKSYVATNASVFLQEWQQRCDSKRTSSQG